MFLLDIIDVIIESFSNEKNNEFINENIDRVILGNNSIIPDMFKLALEITSLNSNMKIEKIFKDSFIVKYNNVYCWITYYRNSENLIDYVITGYLSIDEIMKEM
jgi:hypothetical protein